MKVNTGEILETVSFSEFKIFKTRIDKQFKSISFIFSNGLPVKDNEPVQPGEEYVTISEYDDIFIVSPAYKEKPDEIFSEDNFQQLRELCEIDIYENKLVLKGFTVRPHEKWIEFHITGGVMEGEFVPPEEECDH